jgi:hypothetical protein
MVEFWGVKIYFYGVYLTLLTCSGWFVHLKTKIITYGVRGINGFFKFFSNNAII